MLAESQEWKWSGTDTPLLLFDSPKVSWALNVKNVLVGVIEASLSVLSGEGDGVLVGEEVETMVLVVFVLAACSSRLRVKACAYRVRLFEVGLGMSLIRRAESGSRDGVTV